MSIAALPDYSFRLHRSGPELTAIQSELVLGEREPNDTLELLQVAIGRCELSFATGPVAPRVLALRDKDTREFAIAQADRDADCASLIAMADALQAGDRNHLPDLATLWKEDLASLVRFTGTQAVVTVVNLRFDQRLNGEAYLDPAARYGCVVVDAVDADSYRQAITPADYEGPGGSCKRLGPWTLADLSPDANAGQDNDIRPVQRALREVAQALA